MHDLEKAFKNRPHVVLLGAGASVAAIPSGDKNGKSISIMSGFIQKLGMTDFLKGINLKTKSDNLEEIYSELSEDKTCADVCRRLEDHIYNYFSGFIIPDNPTVYDFLLLSLTKKDVIATFNWDPLLIQAYQRVRTITSDLPEMYFLHGNVLVGFCEKDNVNGPNYQKCPKCGEKLKPVPLLYPVNNKAYDKNIFIRKSWSRFTKGLAKAYMITIFGYSAPKTDAAAIAILKDAWGEIDNRNLEEIEVIDIRPEEDVISSWEQFVHTHHYKVHDNFFSSTLGRCPRRSCEATFDMLMNCIWIDEDKGFKKNMEWEQIKKFLMPLIEEENQNKDVLNNPYKKILKS